MDFEALVKDPKRQISLLMGELGLMETEMYRKNIAKLATIVNEIEIGKGNNYEPSGALIEILQELNLDFTV